MDDVILSRNGPCGVWGVGRIYMSAVLKQVVINSQRIPQVVVVRNSSKLHNGGEVCCLRLLCFGIEMPVLNKKNRTQRYNFTLGS